MKTIPIDGELGRPARCKAAKFGYPTYKPLLDCFVASVQESLRSAVLSVVLYGSVARGNATAASDVDLLLVLEKAPPIFRERIQLLLPILRHLRCQACWADLVAQHIFPSPNVVILSREEADQNLPLYLDMIEEARILLDRRHFFRQRLDKLQDRLRQLGARKIRRDNGWYWDLKPDLKPDEVLVL